jgi:hypothetical protein
MDYSLFAFAAIAILLLVLDRMYRIRPFLSETFTGNGYLQRCGVDMAACPHPLRCMNGYCLSEETAQLRDRNPLPVLP